MQLITSPEQLKDTFIRLTENYDKLRWATAWASNGEPLELLKRYQHKIDAIIVGLHFYQTHPDFIEAFLGTNKVRYIMQTAGTFHPKLYLFYNKDQTEWSMLVGSCNFTNAAFNKNQEVTLLLSSNDNDSHNIFTNGMTLIDNTWRQAKPFDEKELKNYRNVWEIMCTKQQSLKGQYRQQENPKAKPIFQGNIATMTWGEFVERVKNEKQHTFEGRCIMLKEIKQMFLRNILFNQFSELERKRIAGLPKSDENYGWFGSMRGAGYFQNAIINNPTALMALSSALDVIPLTGQIEKGHYEHFIALFKNAFVKNDNYIAPATRLLAMKRPDVFVCYNGANQKKLCSDFGITQHKSYERYWNEIIARIRDFVWYNEPQPQGGDELKIWNARAAFLDSLYWKPKGKE